ncbi:CHAT domain-containing protein [Mycena vulgaris]|nr:CHAT domain-containing protein [Mycena vulgaris]
MSQLISQAPPRHPNLSGYYQSLGEALHQRYKSSRDSNDLSLALKSSQTALELTPESHPARPARLRNLGITLNDRFQMMGALSDLESALQKHQEAVSLTPDGHPDREARLRSLGVALLDRYRRLGNLQDLKAAMKSFQHSVDLTPKDHPNRAENLQSLATAFTERYNQLGNLDDVQSALKLQKAAVDVTPQGHPDRAGYLDTLSTSLTERYKRSGELQDLQSALHMKHEAVDLTPAGDPKRAARLTSLALSLTDRHQRLGDLRDLQAALQMRQEAVKLTREAQLARAAPFSSSFTEQFQKLDVVQNLHSVPGLTQEGAGPFTVEHPTSSLQSTWQAVPARAPVANKLPPSSTFAAYFVALSLLPEIVPMSHSIPARLSSIRGLSTGKITSDGARSAINMSNLPAAVDFIEQGVAMIFQQMLELKPDVTGLEPDQAQRLQSLSSLIYSGASTNAMQLDHERKGLLATIRNQPGFGRFLLPKSYSALSSASQGGPVVILNSHPDGCDGIIIPGPTLEPIHVAFPNVTPELLEGQRAILEELFARTEVEIQGESLSSDYLSSKGRQDFFADVLAWIWTNIVALVYQVLASHGIHDGRLWWLPTGEFIGLPLHASPPNDLFIHSYTSSLESLLHANAQTAPTIARAFSIVGVTAAGNDLRDAAEHEVQKVISIIKEPHMHVLEGEEATVDAVKLQLQNCTWAHLACHGAQNFPTPAKQHLEFHEGVLDLETILRMDLPNAQFIFAATGETAMGNVELANESFHLCGGFIAAGFRAAIGSMWPTKHEDSTLVAEIFYAHLFREGRQPEASETAGALHVAVIELKKRGVPYERWISFVHMGV